MVVNEVEWLEDREPVHSNSRHQADEQRKEFHSRDAARGVEKGKNFHSKTPPVESMRRGMFTRISCCL